MTTTQRKRIPPGVRAKFDRRDGLVRLNVPLSVKAETIDLTERTFEGLAATWDEDLGSDIIHKGAFKNTLAQWKASGEAMPLLNSHDHYDIFSALGQAVQMKETADGLWAKWEVLEGEDGDKTLQRLRPSKTTGRALIGKMSIGFMPIKYDYEQPEGTESFWDRIRHITEAQLKEVSLVLFPMNPNASIDASTVKMWLKMAHDADPKTLDRITRLELRRLNSRIGLLLKKQQPADDEELDDQEDTQTTPSTRTSGAAKSRTPADTDDSADESDDELEDEGTDETDDSDSGEDDDTDDSTVDDEEEPGKSGSAPEAKGKSGSKGTKTAQGTEVPEAPKPYVFSEALSQRLKSVTLKHQLSGSKERS